MNIVKLDSEHIIYFVNSIFMFLNFARIFCLSFRLKPKKRLYHYLASHISITSSICYAMLSNDIFTVDYKGTRIYNARYLDWFINTPMQLVILGNIGQLSYANIYILVLCDLVMITTGWIGEVCDNPFKWVFFTTGIITFVPIYIYLFEDFNYQVVKDFSGEYTASKYYPIGRYLLCTWLFYPIIWIVQNLDLIPDLYACISYTILDFLAKVVFIIWILHIIDRSFYINEDNVDLNNTYIDLHIRD